VETELLPRLYFICYYSNVGSCVFIVKVTVTWASAADLYCST